VVEQAPAGRQQLRERAGVAIDLGVADVLDHADAGDRVIRPVVELTVVGEADLDAVGDAGLGHPPARELGL
jgi:hypothetical protein